MVLVQPQYTLPGVFEANPYPTVEGSIWTLIHEVGCYVGIFVLGVAGLLARRGAMAALLALYALAWIAFLVWEPALHPKLSAFWGLALPFAAGTALYLWQERVPVSIWGVAGLHPRSGARPRCAPTPACRTAHERASLTHATG